MSFLSLPLRSKKLALDFSPFSSNFIAASLYVAVLDIPTSASADLVESPIAPVISSASAPAVGGIALPYSLEFYYQEKPTVAPLAQNPCLECQCWRVESVEGDLSRCRLKQYTRRSPDALYHKSVLGYIRVAESVDLIRLQPVLEADDSCTKKIHGMFSGNYVVEALYRLRMHGMLRTAFWNQEMPKTEFDRLYAAVWKRGAEGRNKSRELIAASFVDLFYCEFATGEHQISIECK